MPIRHCSLLTFAPGTPEEHLDEIVVALRELPAKVEAIETYEVGRDAGLTSGNAQIAVIAGFADADAFRAYGTNRDHVAILDQLIKPCLQSRTASQIEVSALR